MCTRVCVRVCVCVCVCLSVLAIHQCPAWKFECFVSHNTKLGQECHESRNETQLVFSATVLSGLSENFPLAERAVLSQAAHGAAAAGDRRADTDGQEQAEHGAAEPTQQRHEHSGERWGGDVRGPTGQREGWLDREHAGGGDLGDMRGETAGTPGEGQLYKEGSVEQGAGRPTGSVALSAVGSRAHITQDARVCVVGRCTLFFPLFENYP